MSTSRLDAIKQMAAASPADPFPHYGLAMEYKSQGRLDEAEQTFCELERRFADYVPQYLMHANLLCELKRPAEARAVLERGIVVAERTRNGHALGELREALDAL